MVDDGRGMMEEGFVLYCLPGKVWASWLPYPETSSRVTVASLYGVFQTLYVPNKKRRCDLQRLQIIKSS